MVIPFTVTNSDLTKALCAMYSRDLHHQVAIELFYARHIPIFISTPYFAATFTTFSITVGVIGGG